MFVKIGPFDRVAVAKKSPILPFFAPGVCETWIPCEGDHKSPAIHEIDNQFLVADCDFERSRIIFERQK